MKIKNEDVIYVLPSNEDYQEKIRKLELENLILRVEKKALEEADEALRKCLLVAGIVLVVGSLSLALIEYLLN